MSLQLATPQVMRVLQKEVLKTLERQVLQITIMLQVDVHCLHELLNIFFQVLWTLSISKLEVFKKFDQRLYWYLVVDHFLFVKGDFVNCQRLLGCVLVDIWFMQVLH